MRWSKHRTRAAFTPLPRDRMAEAGACGRAVAALPDFAMGSGPGPSCSAMPGAAKMLGRHLARDWYGVAMRQSAQ
ncbi:unnamed protein product [Brugia timori]|uniref:Secreted protein n=1 Tax=Brugia timori TaxID=42155 RepID=A0A0R3Q730_9BILA|nr:unnamed protein product [Brugia timori]